MHKFFEFLLSRKSSEAPRNLNWEAVVEVLAARTALLEDDDLFIIGFCPSRHPALGSDYPGLVIGNVPSLLFPDDGLSYQISFMGPLPEELEEEQLFAAWAAVGFQPFRHKRELTYSRGRLSLLEAAGAIRDALGVINSTYAAGKSCYLEVLGDLPLKRMLDGTTAFKKAGPSHYDFAIIANH
ncbi:MAG: hypothetical protein WAO31_03405 [Rhodoluna sp.]